MDQMIAIVVLNWNGWKDTIECLESLQRVNYPDYYVVLVDNHSADDSLVRIREYCQGALEAESNYFKWDRSNKPLTLVEYSREQSLNAVDEEPTLKGLQPARRLVLIRNELNYGFAEGCNIGIRYALRVLGSRFVMLLNNDTVVDSEFLNELVKVANSDDKIGVLAPKTYYYDSGGRRDIIQYAGARFSPWHELVYRHVGAGLQDEGQFDMDSDTDWCSGAAMMVRSTLLEGFLLNSRYPFGNEDAEFCMNARQAGQRVVYVHKSRVWHKVGVSKRKTGEKIRRDVFSYLWFIRRNFSLSVYVYHIFLFAAVVLPKWMLMDLAIYGDFRSLKSFMSEAKKRIAQKSTTWSK